MPPEKGTGEVRLFGLARIAREAGQHVSEGSALRYLAELPWNPHAMLANRQLGWRELDTRTVEVTTPVGSASVALQLHFDAEGNIVRAWTAARPHTCSPGSEPPSLHSGPCPSHQRLRQVYAEAIM